MTDINSCVTISVPVEMYGLIRRTLTLTYDPGDPSAVRLDLNGRRFIVDRSRLVLGLTIRSLNPDDEAAAAVTVSRLPSGCGDHALLVLRTDHGRWPVAVPAAALTDFLHSTYQVCAAYREQQLVEAALDDHLATITTGGAP